METKPSPYDDDTSGGCICTLAVLGAAALLVGFLKLVLAWTHGR